MPSPKEREFLLAWKEGKDLTKFSKGHRRVLRHQIREQVREASNEIRRFIEYISLLQWFADREGIKIGPPGTYSNLRKMLAVHSLEELPFQEQQRFVKEQNRLIKFTRSQVERQVQQMNAIIAYAERSAASAVVLTAGMRAMNKRILEMEKRHVEWINGYRGRLLLYKIVMGRESKAIDREEIAALLTTSMYLNVLRRKDIQRRTAVRIADEMADRGIFERVPYDKQVRKNGKIISIKKIKYQLTPWGKGLASSILKKRKTSRPSR